MTMMREETVHPLAQIGGTALGGSTKFELIDAPYLDPEESDRFTLVLDLDETLVHYFEQGSEGKCLVRPGAIDFL